MARILRSFARLRSSGLRALAAGAFCALLFGACASSAEIQNSRMGQLLNQDGVLTLVNLHPDEVRSSLYAANFQQDGLIPAGSAVRLDALNGKVLKFTVLDTARTYQYRNHNASGEPFMAHLERIFGTEDPSAEIAGLCQEDQDGIAQGRALPGMTRRGVYLAMGPPPRNITPTQEAPVWQYHRNRWGPKIKVSFDSDGIVVGD